MSSTFLTRLRGRPLAAGVLICCVVGLIFTDVLAAPPLEQLKPTGLLTDAAGVLEPAARRLLEARLRDLERKTSAELAVVTVDSVPDGDVERAAVELVERWGIGKRSKDNGVLILMAVSDRRVRIEVGYGLEGILPDGKTGRIIDQVMLPRFRSGDLAGGLLQGAAAVAGVIAADAGVTLEASPPAAARPMRRRPTLASSIFSLVMLVLMAILFVRNPRLFLLFMLMGGRRGYGGYHSGGFGGGFGGGLGGGFGGFGGGMSGGGGASGSW